MGICDSVTSSNKKNDGFSKSELGSSSFRTGLDSKRTATMLGPGEQFFIKEANANQGLCGDTLREKVELCLAMKNLPIGNQIYRIEVAIAHDVNKIQYISLGVTEDIIQETENVTTSFQMSFFFDYYFEKEQLFKFNILRNNELIVETLTVGKLMGSKNLTIEISLPKLTKSEGDPVCLNLQANKKSSSNTLNAIFSMSTLFNQIIMLDQFPMFYIISRKNNDGNWKKVYKSNEFTIMPSSQSDLNKLSLNKNTLIADNKTTTSQEIKIECYSPINMNTIGIAYLDLFSLKQSNIGTNIIAIRNNNGDTIGDLYIIYDEEEILTFVDYLKFGIDINLLVAIDYTASNGDPNNVNSLHYYGGMTPNNYEKAILACGKIVAYYDQKQMFPVYGFGGIPFGLSQVQHCFPINGQQYNRISGIDNIATMYRQSLSSIKLSGPTYFYHVIKQVLDQIKAEQNPNENKYYILLLLTDGMINDMSETCDVIVEASLYPLSIIIIGIGNSDFSSMNTLDGDDILLSNSKGEVRKRDLVQFVRFNDYKDSCVQNASALAAAVLEEIPRQVDDYYKLTKSFIKKSTGF